MTLRATTALATLAEVPVAKCLASTLRPADSGIVAFFVIQAEAAGLRNIARIGINQDDVVETATVSS